MYSEKRKNYTETFAHQPMVNLSTLAEIKHGSGGKIKPVYITHTNNNLSLSVAIVPGDSIRRNNKQAQTADSSYQMVSSVGFSTIESICEQCDHVYDNNGNITTKKKRSPVEIRGDSKRIEPKITVSSGRSKTRKEPLPMKLRALPQSFWQQPNNTPSQSPGTLCPALPLLCKEEVAECITTEDTPTSLHPEEVPATSCHKEVVSDANTDLLFSLFRVVEEEQRRCQGEPKVTVVRRGRPKKPPRGALKDDDPCLVSTVTESLLPLLPERPSRDMLQARTATQGQQSLAVVSVHGERPATASITTTSPATAATSQNYSHLLSEVVFRL